MTSPEDPRVDLVAGWMLNDRHGEGTLDGYRESARSRLRILDRTVAEVPPTAGTTEAESHER